MTHSSTPRKKPTRRREQGGSATAAPIIAVIAGIALLFAAFLVFGSGILGSLQPGGPAPAQSAGGQGDSPTSAMPQDARVSFVAVGDNLPETSIGAYADACAGEAGDGLYDYRPIYAAVKPYIESADLAYIKQETHLGGDEIGPRGWPSFNTTDTMADAVVATGFDLVASASNHAYDWGYFGAVEHSRSIWNQKPVAFTGTAASEEEAQAIPVVERNGISFALLDYTYGVNGYAQGDLPPYAVSFIDEGRIESDVVRARSMADVVVVAIHWGTENLTEADAEQTRLAQFLADLDVDVVLGSHPHVIGPLAWVEGSSGHRTLVAYSLGNFVSRHDAPALENELGGMLSCDFVKGTDGSVGIENVAWIPLVNHTEEGAYAVYALKDYTPELAARHVLLSQLDDPLGQLDALTRQVIGEEFAIDA